MTAKYPPISAGTRVVTTQATTSEAEWQEEARVQRKWGIRGTVSSHSDSHGLCYLVNHEDGTSGWYEPSEFEILETAGGGASDGLASKVGPGFGDVVAHATDPKTGAIDLRRMEQLEGRFGSNGGRGCDVRRGACSCGAWH